MKKIHYIASAMGLLLSTWSWAGSAPPEAHPPATLPPADSTPVQAPTPIPGVTSHVTASCYDVMEDPQSNWRHPTSIAILLFQGRLSFGRQNLFYNERLVAEFNVKYPSPSTATIDIKEMGGSEVTYETINLSPDFPENTMRFIRGGNYYQCKFNLVKDY